MELSAFRFVHQSNQCVHPIIILSLYIIVFSYSALQKYLTFNYLFSYSALPKRLDLQLFGPFPHNLTAVKGPVHVTISRAFVDFILHDARALDLRRALTTAWGPDEYFFSTLNNNPQLNIPGTSGCESSMLSLASKRARLAPNGTNM